MSELHPKLQREINGLRSDIKAIEALQHEAEIVDRLTEDYRSIIISWYISLTSVTEPSIMIACVINKVSDMTPLIAELAEAGYRQQCDMRTTEETLWWDMGRIEVNARFIEGSSCKMVKVGEEVVDIMAVQCD